MEALRVIGGRRLRGIVEVSGSKNAALPILAASILADGPVCVRGVPNLTDVRTLTAILRRLGVAVDAEQAGGVNQIRLETIDRAPFRADDRLVRKMRAGFCVLGSLLARRGRAVAPLPGGCRIGHRPVDLHLAGLTALGADVVVRRGFVVARAKRLRGATIDLMGPRGPTVTGTANVMAAATLAKGITILRGAAREPEIVDLGNFLISLGARITGLGSSTIRIAGVDQLGAATYRVIPDRVEAATLLIAVAVAGGSAVVRGLLPDHLQAVLHTLGETGARLNIGKDAVTIAADGPPRPMRIVAAPYPGIPTDVQAQLMALAALGAGTSVLRDKVFPERFMHVAELIRLGASIDYRDGRAIVRGAPRLWGAKVAAGDLRASAALALAGLAAHGETLISHIHHLDRGYERLDNKLAGLGARIERLVPRTARSNRHSALAHRAIQCRHA